MAKMMACRDIGMDCNYVARGETTDEVMEKEADHVDKVHHIRVISSELSRKIEGAVHDEKPRFYTT